MSEGLWFIEYDGRLHVVETEHGWQLPTPERLTFEVEEKYRYQWQGTAIIVGEAKNLAFPSHWPSKDEVCAWPNLAPQVAAAIIRSYPRVVVRSVILNAEQQVLVLLQKRGIFAGQWTLPGGYLNWGEGVRAAAMRENLEELGVNTTKLVHLGSTDAVFDSGYHFLCEGFAAEVESFEFQLPEDEIADFQWWSQADAIQQLVPHFDRWAVGKLSSD